MSDTDFSKEYLVTQTPDEDPCPALTEAYRKRAECYDRMQACINRLYRVTESEKIGYALASREYRRAMEAMPEALVKRWCKWRIDHDRREKETPHD